MSRRVLDYDPLTLTTTYHWYDAQTDETTIEEVQEVEHILEQNKREYNNTLGVMASAEDHLGVRVGRIPLKLLEQWGREDGVLYMGSLSDKPQALFSREWKGVARRLRDPAYRFLRTNAKIRT